MISIDLSYISSFTLVTGLKLPLMARIFFLYKTLAGRILLPSGPNITASVIPFLTSSRLIKRLSTSLNSGPEKFTVSISIAPGSM